MKSKLIVVGLALAILTTLVQAVGFEHRDKLGQWFIVELQADGGIDRSVVTFSNHIGGEVPVKVIEKIRGRSSVKVGDVLRVSVHFRESAFPKELAQGKKGDTLFLAVDSPASKVTVATGKINIFCGIDKAQKALLEKEKGLPIGWQYRGDKLHSFWVSCGSKLPNPDYFPPANPKLICPETGMSGYTCGDADVTMDIVVPPASHYNLKKFQPRAEELIKVLHGMNRLNRPLYLNDRAHKVVITVTNRQKETITVPAIRTVGDKILWNHSAQAIVICHGHAAIKHTSKQFMPRATVAQKTEALVLEPGKSVTGEVDLYLMEDPTKVDMYGYCPVAMFGVVLVGDVSKAFALECDPIGVWGVYNKVLPGVPAPIYDGWGDKKVLTKDLEAKFAERVRRCLPPAEK
jgi:hypothetical protein